MTYRTTIDPNPWMTRQEARDYLGFSESTIDRLTAAWDGKSKAVKGKIRAYPMRFPGGQRHWPRLVKRDVYALLPRPDAVEAEEPRLE